MKIKKHSGHTRPRHIRRAQINEMKKLWPAFEMSQSEDGTIFWRGPLRGFQKTYVVGILWNEKNSNRPYVFLIKPRLTPRQGGAFEDIPHLMYYSEDPRLSGLCLFDPDGNEWSPDKPIAETTLPWAAQWLLYYELWHYDGKWRGGGVGPESVAQPRAETIRGASEEHASLSQKEAPVAIKQALQNTVT